MKNTNLDTLKQDLKNLSPADFAKKYPKIEREQIKDLSDSELGEAVGGVVDTNDVIKTRYRIGSNWSGN